MPQPTPEPFDPADLAELAAAVVKTDRFQYLATLDGNQPRLRPVSPVRTEGFTVYVANLRSYHKTGEIAANPRVELCYLDEQHHQVRITGTADVVTDRATQTIAARYGDGPVFGKIRGYVIVAVA